MNPQDFYNEVKQASHLFAGITDATMTHGEAWHFSRLGRMLERADKTSRILDVKYFLLLHSAEEVGTPFDDIQWVAVLRSASRLRDVSPSAMAASRRAAVVDFLMLDAEFPRAVRFCLLAARDSLARHQRHAVGHLPPSPRKTSGPALLGPVLCRRGGDNPARPARISG